MDATLDQDEWAKEIEIKKKKGEKVQQCVGCKCSNTQCLKLYCECLKNKATCGPLCQCKKVGEANEICLNTPMHTKERR